MAVYWCHEPAVHEKHRKSQDLVPLYRVEVTLKPVCSSKLVNSTILKRSNPVIFECSMDRKCVVFTGYFMKFSMNNIYQMKHF